MEILFDYETAKHTLVLTAYCTLIIFECFWIGYLIASVAGWIAKGVKHLYKKVCKKNDSVEQDEPKEDITNE